MTDVELFAAVAFPEADLGDEKMAEFITMKVKTTAYHEAGHASAAADPRDSERFN